MEGIGQTIHRLMRGKEEDRLILRIKRGKEEDRLYSTQAEERG